LEDKNHQIWTPYAKDMECGYSEIEEKNINSKKACMNICTEYMYMSWYRSKKTCECHYKCEKTNSVQMSNYENVVYECHMNTPAMFMISTLYKLARSNIPAFSEVSTRAPESNQNLSALADTVSTIQAIKQEEDTEPIRSF